MALKSKIAKDVFDALPEALQAEYKVSGDMYVLDVDDEDVGKLRRAHERTKLENNDFKTRLTTLQAQHEALVETLGVDSEAAMRKAKDIEGLEKTWKAKSEEAVKGERDLRIKRDSQLIDYLETNSINDIAARIAVPKKIGLLTPHLRGRVKADLSGDTPAVKYLDKDGKEMALADFEKEFRGNELFADIISAGQGSGGGAPGGTQGGGAPSTKKLSQMSGEERLKMARENPAEFGKLTAAAQKANTAI